MLRKLAGSWVRSHAGLEVVAVLFLVAAQIKKNDDHSYSKVTKYEHAPNLVYILPPQTNTGLCGGGMEGSGGQCSVTKMRSTYWIGESHTIVEQLHSVLVMCLGLFRLSSGLVSTPQTTKTCNIVHYLVMIRKHKIISHYTTLYTDFL
jgi:hypothetical protein